MDFKRVNLLFCLELDKTSGDGPEGKKLADDKRKALAKCHKDVLSPRDCSELEEGFDILHPESYLGRRNGHGSVMDLITRIHKEEILRDGLSILIAFQLHEKNIGPKRDVDALKELGITQEFINTDHVQRSPRSKVGARKILILYSFEDIDSIKDLLPAYNINLLYDLSPLVPHLSVQGTEESIRQITQDHKNRIQDIHNVQKF